MRTTRTNQFDHVVCQELREEFLQYSTLGHAAILCARPDFVRHLSYPEKTKLVEHFESAYTPAAATRDSLDHANAHLAIELQRGAFLLSGFSIRQLQRTGRDDLLAIIRGSHRGGAHDVDFSLLDYAHTHIQASPPTRADALAPLLPPDSHPDR